jgi:hypothetical protein
MEINNATNEEFIYAEIPQAIKDLKKLNKEKYEGHLFAEFGFGDFKTFVFPTPIERVSGDEKMTEFLTVTKKGYGVISVSSLETGVVDKIGDIIRDKIKKDKENPILKSLDITRGFFDMDGDGEPEILTLKRNLTITREGMREDAVVGYFVERHCKVEKINVIQAGNMLRAIQKKMPTPPTK